MHAPVQRLARTSGSVPFAYTMPACAWPPHPRPTAPVAASCAQLLSSYYLCNLLLPRLPLSCLATPHAPHPACKLHRTDCTDRTVHLAHAGRVTRARPRSLVFKRQGQGACCINKAAGQPADRPGQCCAARANDTSLSTCAWEHTAASVSVAIAR